MLFGALFLPSHEVVENSVKGTNQSSRVCELYLNQGDFQKSISCSNKILEREPADSKILIVKARSFQSLGNHAAAFLYFWQAWQNSDKNDTTLLDNLGKELLLSNPSVINAIDGSSGYYDQALKIDPNDVDALGGKGRALLQMNNPEEAIGYFDQALKIDPNDVDALGGKGRALLQMNNPEEAIGYFDQALKIDPANKESLDNYKTSFDELSNQDKTKDDQFPHILLLAASLITLVGTGSMVMPALKKRYPKCKKPIL